MASSFGSWEDQKSFPWKDFPNNADDLGSALDLAVQALGRVGRVQLGAMFLREGHVGQDIVLGVIHQRGELRHLGPDLVGHQKPKDPGKIYALHEPEVVGISKG